VFSHFILGNMGGGLDIIVTFYHRTWGRRGYNSHTLFECIGGLYHIHILSRERRVVWVS